MKKIRDLISTSSFDLTLEVSAGSGKTVELKFVVRLQARLATP
jgi:hypothetical protein